MGIDMERMPDSDRSGADDAMHATDFLSWSGMRNVRSFFQSSLALGLIWAWFICAGNAGPNTFGIEVSGSAYFQNASVLAAIVVMVIVPGISERPFLTKSILICGVIACVLGTALFAFTHVYFTGSVSLVVICGMFSGLSYALLLFVWIKKNISVNFIQLFAKVICASIAMVILYLAVSALPEDISSWMALLLVVAAAILLDRAREDARETIDSPSSNDRAHFFISLVLSGGFANGILIHTWVMSNPIGWTYALAPFGILVLIVSFALKRHFSPYTALSLLAAFMCAALLLALALPSGIALLSSMIFAGAWFLFAFSVAASVWSGAHRGERAIRTACAYVACIFAAVLGSNAVLLLGVQNDLVFLVVAAVLIAFSLALAVASESRLLHAQRKKAEGSDMRDIELRCKALASRRALTEREYDVLCLLARGYSIKGIADRLLLSENTVKSHRRRIYLKLEINSRQSLIELIEGISI